MIRKQTYRNCIMHSFFTTSSTHSLEVDLDTALGTRRTTAQLGEQVGDVVPWVAVEAGPQTLLVEEMGNETDGAAEDKETVEHTHLEVVFSLLGGECATVAEQVDKADGDAAVDVEDQVVLLAGGDGLDGDGVVEELGRGEVCLAELLDEGYTEIGVVARLDTMTDTRD